MDYQKAKDIRGKGFASTVTDKLLSGQGIGESFKSTISDKTKATVTGIKQRFDPMNIVKMMTFGSNLGPALFGKMTGRKKSDMQFFTGGKNKTGEKVGKSTQVSGIAVDFATEILGEIYKLLQKIEEERKLAEELKANRFEDEEDKLNKRNEEIIKALTGRRAKQPTRRELAKKKKEEVKEKKQAKREEKKAEVKTPEVKPTVKEAPKPAPKVPEKVPTGPRPTVPTAVKAAAGAAVVGGLLMPSETVAASIDKASDAVGVDKSLMYAMAKQESGFDPGAAAKTSSAKGLYQFIKDTWDTMVQKYGSKYPILKQKGPNDPDANAIAGALFIKENSDSLKKANIPVNATTIYAAHFLGAGGAKQLLTADPNKNAAELMPKAAAANKFIFYDKTNDRPDVSKPKTVQKVIDTLFEKVGKYQDLYAQKLGAPSTGTKIETSSKENTQLKETINSQQKKTTINNAAVNYTQNSQQFQQDIPEDSSAYSRKSTGKKA